MDQALKNPKVTVVIATYNGERFIRHAIESVLSQTMKDIEIILVDDGSTDGTPEILRSYAGRDAEMRVMRQENAGPASARNSAMKEAKGDYIALIDDDDVWNDKSKLAVQAAFLDAHQECVLVGCSKARLIDEEGSLKGYAQVPSSDRKIRSIFLRRNCFFASSAMFRKEAALSVGGFKDLRLAEDYDLWLKLGTRGKLANIPDLEISYRDRSSSVSAKRRLDMYRQIASVISFHKDEYPGYWLGSIKAALRIAHFHIFGK